VNAVRHTFLATLIYLVPGRLLLCHCRGREAESGAADAMKEDPTAATNDFLFLACCHYIAFFYGSPKSQCPSLVGVVARPLATGIHFQFGRRAAPLLAPEFAADPFVLAPVKEKKRRKHIKATLFLQLFPARDRRPAKKFVSATQLPAVRIAWRRLVAGFSFDSTAGDPFFQIC
jgi:hypothetical protein